MSRRVSGLAPYNEDNRRQANSLPPITTALRYWPAIIGESSRFLGISAIVLCAVGAWATTSQKPGS